MLNNIGLPGLLVIGAFVGLIYWLVIAPARKKSNENGSSVFYEITPTFWLFIGVILGVAGWVGYHFSRDPSFLGQAAMEGANPIEVANFLSTVGIIGLGLGGIFLLLGLARMILVPK